MDLLEREMGYKEELFDFIQQFLRTILLKRIFIFRQLIQTAHHYIISPPVTTNLISHFSPCYHRYQLSNHSSTPLNTQNSLNRTLSIAIPYSSLAGGIHGEKYACYEMALMSKVSVQDGASTLLPSSTPIKTTKQ
jgi:hypothetical protein